MYLKLIGIRALVMFECVSGIKRKGTNVNIATSNKSIEKKDTKILFEKAFYLILSS
jgi:hypothetical protein